MEGHGHGMGIEGLEPLAACLFASLTLYSPREPPTFVWVTFLACNLYIFCILRLYFAGYQNKNYVAEQYEWWEGEEVWCYPGLWAWEILLQGAQPICHALRIPLFAYVCCLLVPPLSFIFQLFHFLFFYTTQKPRPCLMCKKQPSAATFLHGLFARSRRVADEETRRPSNGPWNVFKLRKQLRVLKLSNASETRMGMEMRNVKSGTKAVQSELLVTPTSVYTSMSSMASELQLPQRR